MEIAQIVLYGGKHRWLDLALKEFPQTRLLIVVQNTVADFPEYWELVETKISVLEQEQTLIRDDLRVTLKLVEIHEVWSLPDLTRYFRALVRVIAGQGLPVTCNVTAGIFEYQLALYLASQIESNQVREIFYHNKQTGAKTALPLATSVTRKEQRVLDLLWMFEEKTGASSNDLRSPPSEGGEEANLSTIRDFGETEGIDMDLSNLSRLVTKLVRKGFVSERREGRDKFIQLTAQGRVFCPITTLQDAVEAELGIKGGQS